MRLRALVVAAGLLWPAPALAVTFLNGDELYEDCTSTKDLELALCAGYVMGASDALQVEKVTCPPQSVTARQTVGVVTNFLQDHPELRQHAAYSVIGLALQQAFPCEEQAH